MRLSVIKSEWVIRGDCWWHNAHNNIHIYLLCITLFYISYLYLSYWLISVKVAVASWALSICMIAPVLNPDSKDHGAKMGPTWVLSAPSGPHVGPMNLAIGDEAIPRNSGDEDKNKDSKAQHRIHTFLSLNSELCLISPHSSRIVCFRVHCCTLRNTFPVCVSSSVISANFSFLWLLVFLFFLFSSIGVW